MSEYPIAPDPLPEAPAVDTSSGVSPHSFAETLLLHPYRAVAFLAVLFVVGAGALVLSRAPVAPSDDEARWQTGGYALFQGETRRPDSSVRVRTEDVIKTQKPDAALPLLPTLTQPVLYVPDSDAQTDIDTLLASLTKKSGQTESQDDRGESALSFIPEGLVSTSSPQQRKTAKQVRLYDYANTVGTYIQGLESSHTNMAQSLTAVIQDRGNAEKIANAERIAAAYGDLAESLKQVTTPSEVRALHDAFVRAHAAIDTHLRAVVRSTTDTDLISTIRTYNESADQYIKSYLALVTFFESEDVRFDRFDPGSIFTFSSASL